MISNLINQVKYIEDCQVDNVLDKKIREILSNCFTYEEKFKTQRFCNEPPKHRWYIEVDNKIVAHIAVHQKQFICEGKKEDFIGIAEVCVAEGYRNLNLAKQLLSLAENNFSNCKYSILLGDSTYYQSSGYKKVNNLYFSSNPEEANVWGMVKRLKNCEWYNGKVMIEGMPF